MDVGRTSAVLSPIGNHSVGILSVVQVPEYSQSIKMGVSMTGRMLDPLVIFKGKEDDVE